MKKQFTDKIIILLLASATSILTCACELPFGITIGEDDEKTYLEQGMDAVEAGDYQNAINLFNTSLDSGEDLRLVYRGRGIAKMATADYVGATEDFKTALAQSNGIIEDVDIDIAYYLAAAEYKTGNPEAAIGTYSAILNIRPEEDNACYLRGKTYLLQGNKEAAITDYESALTLAPKDYDHYLRICTDLTEAGYESEGKAYINRAMESGNKLSDYQLGVFNYYLGNYTEARNYLENARSSKNVGEDIIMYLGQTYEALGDPGYAISLYESFVAQNPSSSAPYVRIGMAKMGQRDYEGALDAFEAGIATGDGVYMQSLLYNRIVANEYLLNFDEAAKLMTEYLAAYPDDEKAKRENKFLSTR